jgi:hypothetical protein
VSIFIETEETKAAIQACVEHAEKVENYYWPHKTRPPYEDPRLRLVIGSFRLVFSFTVGKKGVYRQLSVSVPGAKEGRLPNPAIVMEIAKHFGFDQDREPPIQMVPADECIILAQLLPKETTP